MNTQADEIIDSEIKDSHQKVNDASYQLWQGLLTVNGFLVTVLIGIATFSDIQVYWIKQIVFATVVCLFLSSLLIIITMLITKQVFHKIYNTLFEAKMYDKKPDENKNMVFAAIRGLIRFIAEPLALVLQLTSVILIVTYLYFVLFSATKPILTPSANVKSGIHHDKQPLKASTQN